MRRCLLRLFATLKSHLAEEELHEPILEDRLTPDEAEELAPRARPRRDWDAPAAWLVRALVHLSAKPAR